MDSSTLKGPCHKDIAFLVFCPCIKSSCGFIVKQISEAGKLPTHPFPKLTLTLTSHLGQNDGLGEG